MLCFALYYSSFLDEYLSAISLGVPTISETKHFGKELGCIRVGNKSPAGVKKTSFGYLQHVVFHS